MEYVLLIPFGLYVLHKGFVVFNHFKFDREKRIYKKYRDDIYNDEDDITRWKPFRWRYEQKKSEKNN